ncbi:MAG TPA: translocation/assembly module TamB domain-containing protein [Vicinamibacterales bacterium]|nr:translocation/assembly module TamB domain-containing protein [Vicinamibacterales bacterium]
MLKRALRLLALAAIAVVASVAIGLLVLHTDPVQARILQWSVGELERRFDLDLTADDLHYNLATRRVTMTNVRLAALDHPDNPFFVAQTVGVKLPWAVFRGQVRFDEVTVESGSVTISRDANGDANLPPGRGERDPNAPPRRIDLRGLQVRNLDFVYRDFQRDIEISTPRIRTNLAWDSDAQGATGPFAIEQDVRVRTGDRSVTVKPITGEMTFKGSDVELESVRLDTTDGVFLVSGEIDRALDQPTLDLTFDGTTELAQSSRWATPPIHIAGQASIDARMTGAPSAFVLDATVVAENAEVGTQRGVRIEAEAQLTPDGVTVARSAIRPATGGEVQATMDLPFADNLPWWIKANYTGLDAASALRMAEVRALPFGAALTGAALITRAPGEPFRLEVHNTSSPRQAPGTAPLEGTVEFIIDGHRWRANQDHRMGVTHVTGPIGGVWNREAATRSTFDGTLTVATQDVGEAARYAALFDLTTPEIVRTASGPLSAEVIMGGTFTEPRFVGTARSDGIDIPPLGRTALSADFDASERALHATNIDATIGTTTIRGDVRADLVSRELDGRLQVASPDAADLLSAMPEDLRLEGPVSATATLGGTVDTPDIAAELSGKELTLAGQPVASLSATARLVGDGVNIDRLTIRQDDGGELVASGRYEWGAESYAVDLSGQNLIWRGALAGLGDAQAHLALKFSGAGPLDRPVGDGTIEFAVTGGVAGQLIDRGVANVRLNGESALVTGHIPALGAFITGTVIPRAPFAYESVIVLNRIDLAPVATIAGLEQGHVTGTASLSATAKGELSSIAQSDAFINLQDIQASVADVRVQLVTPARLAWDGASLSVDSLDMAVGQGRLHASGQLGEGGIDAARWEATFKGELGDLLTLGWPFGVPADLEGAGPVDFVWQSTGGIDRSTASLHLEGASVGWTALPAIRDLRLDATFDGTTLNLTQLTGRWQDGGIEGTASIPRAVLQARETGGAPLPAGQPGFAKLRVSGLTESSLAPWLNTATLAGITGRLSTTLDARITHASLDGISGTVVADEADFTVAGVSVRQERALIFEIDGGVITARDVAFDAGGGPMVLTGTARLTPTDKQVLDFDLRGSADLQILSAFAPTIATAGKAELNVGIGGTPREPVFNGRIDVAGAEVAIREPRIVISELNGIIAMDGQRVVFDAFTGTANGGRLQLDGGFLLEGFTPVSGGLTVVVERAALEYPQGLQSEANAIVTLRPGPAGWSLLGDIIVERSAYTAPISVAGLIAARGMRAPVAGDDDSWIDQLRLNLWVTTLQNVVVDNNYGRFEAAAALRVIGTVAEPVLAGRITLDEGGEVYLAGNTFHIERGSISFANPFRIVPEFDIELRTLVGGTDITLTLDGPLDRLQTDVRSSDPAVDSREAIAMLFGGLQGEDAVTLLSAELLGATGRAIGLDTLRVERGFDLDEYRADPGLIATETDPATRLTIAKRLRPDVELILSQSLRESGGLSAVISYKPRRNIEIRAASRDNIDRSVALRHEITFGGAGTATGGSTAPAMRVSTVTITGDPRRPVEELIAMLDLDPGEPFNFHEWQEDVDRLREAYHERNHYEVRVRGIRRPSDDEKTVALEYSIEPGPVGELVIEGHPLEPNLQADIREAWRRTIFDRFLLEDIRTRIERHLLEENVIGSQVEVSVAVSTPERKQIRVVVTAGTAVASREVRYDGNTRYSRDRLDGVLAESGLAIDGWLDPRRTAEAIEDFYRAEGFLTVTLKTEPPGIVGSTGVLPVLIDEGLQFVIGSLSFPGVSPERLTDVVDAVRLYRGMPFVTAEIDAARQRVERLYAREGFNNVQIEVDSTVDTEDARVDLSFAVLEGLQQVLREVTTEGATRTQEGIIRRALRLRIGEPVDLASWSQARKRLYDTNVFRQVDIEPVPMTPTAAESAAGLQPVRAVVRVVEYPVWRLRYGAQFNDETALESGPDGDGRLQSLGILADLQNQNLFGRAITAGIAGRYERNRQAGSLFTSNSSFFGLPIRSSAFLFTSRQRFPHDEFPTIDERVGLSAEQRWRPLRTAEVLWSYRILRNHATVENLPPEFQTVPVRVARLTATMYFDRRDDPSDPTGGWFASANWEQAVQKLGSDYSNGKALTKAAIYHGVGELTLAGRVQLGTGYGEEGLIFSERFLLGGATTVRGYAENSLGPRNPSLPDFPLGGDALLAFNGEVRFPVRGWVQGVGFLDAGNVFKRRSDISIGDLAVGYGIGLRLASPFAMLRIDFGVPAKTLRPDRPAHQWKSGRWYFGVGHIF